MNNYFWLFGTKVHILSDVEINNSDFDLVEGMFPPGAQSPLHVHTKYSETLYVLDGEAIVYTPKLVQNVKVGESFHIPANIPHCIVNGSDEKNFRALVVAHPGGFAKLIRAIGIVEDENIALQQHDMELAGQIMEEVGDIILGPPGIRP